jgi:hypothetical protein
MKKNPERKNRTRVISAKIIGTKADKKVITVTFLSVIRCLF